MQEAIAYSETNKLKSVELNEVAEPWWRVSRAIENIPDHMGVPISPNDPHFGGLVAIYRNESPEGIYFKEQMHRVTEAWRHLTDRVVEMRNAKGSLVKMGVGSEKVSFKGLEFSIQEIEPVDFQILVNLRGFLGLEYPQDIPLNIPKRLTKALDCDRVGGNKGIILFSKFIIK